MSQEQARSTVLIDNERVRVTEWRFAPGAATGYHRHAYDLCWSCHDNGDVITQSPDGDHEAELTQGVPYFRHVGVEHDVINANAYEFVFVETELK